MICNLCPRGCHAVRTDDYGGGACGMPWKPVVAKTMLHRWEEPCLSGGQGAGAVFFAGCALGCVYCQNGAISRPKESAWATVSAAELRTMFWDLIERGASCLDLVTPSHFAPVVREALRGETWPAPVVWNSGGYERADVLRTLEGLVQVYLPDLKYALPGPAEAYSAARMGGPGDSGNVSSDGTLSHGERATAFRRADTSLDVTRRNGEYQTGYRLGSADVPSGGGPVFAHAPVYAASGRDREVGAARHGRGIPGGDGVPVQLRRR